MNRDITLITGATGLVGRKLVAALRATGSPVRIVSRRAAVAGFDSGVEVAQWNGSELGADALDGVGALVHLAGEPVFGGLPTAARKERIRSSRIDSTRALVESMAALPEDVRPDRFICASAVGYYGSRGDDPLTESEPHGEGFLAEVCRDWEAAARAAEAHGLRVLSVRIGIVLAADGGALPKIALPFRAGLGGRLGDGRQWFPWIHVDDLVRLLHTALGDARYQGAVNGVAPNPVRNLDLTRALGRALSRPSLLPVPAFALRMALGDLAGELLGSRRVFPQAALERGFEFHYPELETALKALL